MIHEIYFEKKLRNLAYSFENHWIYTVEDALKREEFKSLVEDLSKLPKSKSKKCFIF
jgi:hypothetical protein